MITLFLFFILTYVYFKNNNINNVINNNNNINNNVASNKQWYKYVIHNTLLEKEVKN